MTDASGPHADLDALADALAAESDGLPLPDHLQACPECAAALSALRAALAPVAADLAALPAVPPVPAVLEQPVRPVATGLAAATVLPAAEVTSLDERRGGAPRWLLFGGGIAAAAVLVVGGGLLLASNATDSASKSTASSPREQFPVSATGADYRTPTALQSALPRLLKGEQQSVDSLAQPEKATPVTQSGGTDPLARLRTPAALATCLASLTGPDDTSLPLALDYASWKGQPALIVVLPAAKPSKVDIWVVAATCAQLDPNDANLLQYVKTDRPTR